MKVKTLTLLFLVLLTSETVTTTDIQITNLDNPILPIQIGNARLVYTKHTFIHYIDLEIIINQLENIKSLFITIKDKFNVVNASNHISYHGLAENLLSRTEYLIQVTSDKLENLHPHIRKERGLINAVGKINKWLFGTLDADDGNFYKSAINTLEKNQNSLVKELELQISLSKSIINNYNDTISKLDENQRKLHIGLKMFQVSVQSTINSLEDYLSFHGIITQLNLDCQNIIMFLDNLEDAIMFAKVNALHNSILSISELNKMLKYLTLIYKNNQIPQFKNILSFYQILGTQVNFIGTQVIFAVHVPILRSETFSFYHIYPIIQNQSIFVPQYPYMAQAEKKKQFTAEACPIVEEVYLCKEEIHPRDICVENLLDGIDLENCPITKVNLSEPIIQQITQDSVLIIPQKPEKLLAKCNTDQYVKIDKPVLIKIPKDCGIEVNEERFFNNVKIQPGKPLILPKIKLAEINATKFLATPTLSKINFDEIYRLRDMAERIIPISPVPKETNVFQIIVIIFGILVVLLFALFQRKKLLSIWKRKFKKTSKNEERSPKENFENPPKKRSVIFEA